MAKEDIKEDIYALTKPNGSPAYPKWVYIPTGNKYPNGEDINNSFIVKDPDEHKRVLAGQKGEGKPAWGNQG